MTQSRPLHVSLNDYSFLGDEETDAVPEFSLVTITLPEEGRVKAADSSLYALSFANTSSYVFAIKIDYAIVVK